MAYYLLSCHSCDSKPFYLSKLKQMVISRIPGLAPQQCSNSSETNNNPMQDSEKVPDVQRPHINRFLLLKFL
ncbi:hypothetical protein OIU74_020702, partial [Salix koriyanagi]